MILSQTPLAVLSSQSTRALFQVPTLPESSHDERIYQAPQTKNK